MVMVYRIKSEGYPPVQKKLTGLAQLETIFYDRYLQAIKTGDNKEKLKYLTYFNHVVKMRNRLEFGIPTE